MIQIKPYSPADEEGIKALCRIPISEKIYISLEREPSYMTGALVQCEVPSVYVALDEQNKVVGVCNIGTRRLWYRQQIVSVPYLCDLRIDKSHKGLQILTRFSKIYLEMHGKGTFPGQTIVFSDNKLMLGLIEKRRYRSQLLKFPYYHSQGTYVSTFLQRTTIRQLAPEEFSIVPASKSNLEELQQFIYNESAKIDYFPYYDLSELSNAYYEGTKLDDFLILYKGNKIQGVCGIWDQSEIKQTRIKGYSKLIRIFRKIYNAYAFMSTKMKLPLPGEKINYLTLHTILIQDRSKKLFSYLIQRIQELKLKDKDQYLLIGLDQNDPLYESLKEFNVARQVTGQYFHVTTQENSPTGSGDSFFYFEAARI